MASQAYAGNTPTIQINVDRGQLRRALTIPQDLVHWKARAFERYLEEHGNGHQEREFRVYDLPNERWEIIERVLDIFVHGRVPGGLPSLRISKLNLLVDIYATANRLKLHTVMNVVLDALLVDFNSEGFFPSTLVVYIYQITEKESGIRRMFMEQVTISMDTEDFKDFAGHWPTEALIDLAVHCMGRYIPPDHIESMSKYYQPPFDAYSDLE